MMRRGLKGLKGLKGRYGNRSPLRLQTKFGTKVVLDWGSSSESSQSNLCIARALSVVGWPEHSFPSSHQDRK